MRRKGNKYHNHKIEVDGIKFDSMKESQRYLFLKEAEQRGEINGLSLQVPFELIPSIKEEYEKQLKTKVVTRVRIIQLAINYRADFCYTKSNGEFVVEDVKPSPKMIPADYKLKEKLFFWRFGRQIRRIYEPNEPI